MQRIFQRISYRRCYNTESLPVLTFFRGCCRCYFNFWLVVISIFLKYRHCIGEETDRRGRTSLVIYAYILLVCVRVASGNNWAAWDERVLRIGAVDQTSDSRGSLPSHHVFVLCPGLHGREKQRSLQTLVTVCSSLSSLIKISKTPILTIRI